MCTAPVRILGERHEPRTHRGGQEEHQHDDEAEHR